MYYVFNEALREQIAQAIPQTTGFFYFKAHQKCVEITKIPSSNTNSSPVFLYRTVYILETNFSDKFASLKEQSEALAEYYSESSLKILAYLRLTDEQTVGKTTEQINNAI